MSAHPPSVPIGGAAPSADPPARPAPAQSAPDDPAEPATASTGALGPRPLDPAVVAALSRPDWRARLDDLTGGWGLTPTSLAVGAVAVAAMAFAVLGPWWEGGAPGAATVALPMVDATGSSPGTSPPTPAAPADGPGPATAAGAAAPPATVPSTVVVHAAGSVMAPGVHRLPAGARIGDLVEAAGGATADADLDRVNLAAPLVDGSRVHVPRLGEPDVVEVPAVASAPVGPVAVDGDPSGAAGSRPPMSLSTASAADLEELPGVGPATAAAIIEHRERTGGFRTVDELLDVRGIGETRLEQLRPLVVP